MKKLLLLTHDPSLDLGRYRDEMLKMSPDGRQELIDSYLKSARMLKETRKALKALRAEMNLKLEADELYELYEQKFELKDTIECLKVDLPDWRVIKRLSVMHEAKLVAQSWFDELASDKLVELDLSSACSMREKVGLVARYELELGTALEDLRALPVEFFVDLLPHLDRVVARQVYREFRRLLARKGRELVTAQKTHFGLQVFQDARSWNRISGRIDLVKRRLTATKSSIQKTQWAHQFSGLYNKLKRKVELEETDSASYAEELKEATQILSSVIFERAQTLGLQSGAAFGDLSAVQMKFTHLGESELMVDFKDSVQGRQDSGLAVLAKILGDEGLLEQTRVWTFTRTGLSQETKESPELWKAVAEICIQYGFICLANNGSRMLIQVVDRDGNLSALARVLDALFENVSQVGAYGLSLLNAKPVSRIGSEHHIPINSDWDGGGRKCLTIVYDSKQVGLTPGTDGGTVNNFLFYGQHRSFSIKKEAGKLYGAFYKGFAAHARFTIVDGDFWTINDLRNVKRDMADFEDEDFEEEIKAWKQGDPLSPELQEALDERGHYLFVGTREAESLYRMQRWESWFDANKELPYVMAYEVGELKGIGKATYPRLIDYQPLVKMSDGTFMTEADAFYVSKDYEAYEPKSLADYLSHVHGFAVIEASTYGHSIVDAPRDSSTSASFQLGAPLITRAFQPGEYNFLMQKFLGRFSHREEGGTRIPTLDTILSGIRNVKCTVRYPEALLRNPVTSFWRFFTNTDKTTCPTRRILMEDKGYRGFTIVEDGNYNLYAEVDGKRQLMPTSMAAWRSPLIVPSAIQAPVALNRELIVKLLVALDKDESKRSDLDKRRLKIVLERLMFKQKLSRKAALKKLPSMLESMLETAEAISDSRIILMDVNDVEDMQGDDDGDTVTVDFDQAFVALCQGTERFWRRFYEANNLRPIKIEMSKKLAIDFGKANSIYDGVPFDLEQAQFVELFGVECPLVAQAYNMGGTKIPSPLGLNFAKLVEINKKVGGRLLKDADSLWAILFKLGSTPTGPIGAPSNGAPDLLIRALAQTDENLVLNEYGRRLWQAYSTLSSTVQVSIDWAKRVYDILCLIMYDQKKEDGSWLMDFEHEITPEAAKDYLVKNTFSKVDFVTFKLCCQEGKRTQTIGSKMLRIVVSDDEKYELFQADSQFIFDSDTTKIYRVEAQADVEALAEVEKFLAPNNASLWITPSKVEHINLMDETNACYSFDSIYAVGSFMIQPPRRGETGWGPIEGLAAFKKEITDLLKTVEIKDRQDNVVEVRFGKHGTAARTALMQSYSNSALVRNATHFMDYYIRDGREAIKDIIGYPQKVKEEAKKSGVGKHLDHFFSEINVEVGAFFSENYRSDGGQLKRSQVLRKVYAVIGLDANMVEEMLLHPDREVRVGKIDHPNSFTLTAIELIAMLFRNDPRVGSEDVPQCLAQMLIAEVLERSEENLFTGLTLQLESAIKGRFFNRFEPFTRRDGVKYQVLPSRLNPFVKGDRFAGLEHLLQGLYSVDDDKVQWLSPQACFQGLARILEWDKNAVLSSPGFANDAQRALKVALLQHDAYRVSRDFLSAIKDALASVNQWARKLKSFAKVTQFPVRLFDSKGAFEEKRVSSVQDLHPENLFASKFLAAEAVLQRLVNQQQLPEAQYSRTTQNIVIRRLASRGYPIKSFSYFGNSGIKYPDDIRALHYATTRPLECFRPMHVSGKPITECRARFYSLLCLNMLGQEVEKVLPTLFKYNIMWLNEQKQPLSHIRQWLCLDAPPHSSGRSLVRLTDGAFQALGNLNYSMSNAAAEYRVERAQFWQVLEFETCLADFVKTGQPNKFVVAQVVDKGTTIWHFQGRRYFNREDAIKAVQSRMAL